MKDSTPLTVPDKSDSGMQETRKGKKSLIKSMELAGAGVNNEARRGCYGSLVCKGGCKK